MNTPINFEIAKLLKEKGYPQLNTGLYYTKDKNHCLVGWGFNDRTEDSFAQYSASTIAEVIMWLYEKHRIWISVNREPETGVFYYSVDKNKGDFFYDKGDDFNSPTEAYEAAIEYTLKNLIKT